MFRLTKLGALLVLALLPAIALASAADDMFSGKVVGVTDDKLMIMGDKNADARTFSITTETRITRNGKSARLSEIQNGDKAMVSATGMGSKFVAKEITVSSPE